MRVVVTGNGGSGKTTLGDEIGRVLGCPVFQLDDIMWMLGGWMRAATPEAETRTAEQVSAFGVRDSWVVEGAFGEYAAWFLDGADVLVWLDLPWSPCEEWIWARKADPDKAGEQDTAMLIEWASGYHTRTPPSSLRVLCGEPRVDRALESLPGRVRRQR
jgi:adenylate kinase family enzyme